MAPVQLVPLLSLGCRVEMRSCAADAAASELQYFALEQREPVGGAPLQVVQRPPLHLKKQIPYS